MTTKKNAAIASMLDDEWLSTSGTFEQEPTPPVRRKPAPPSNDDWMSDSDEDDERPATVKAPTPRAKVEPAPSKPARKPAPVFAADDEWLGDLDQEAKPRAKKAQKARPRHEVEAAEPEGSSEGLKPRRRSILTHSLACGGGFAAGLILAMLFRPASTPVEPPAKQDQKQAATEQKPAPSPTPQPEPQPQPAPNPGPSDPPHRHPNPFIDQTTTPPSNNTTTGPAGQDSRPVPQPSPNPGPSRTTSSIGAAPAVIDFDDYRTPPAPR